MDLYRSILSFFARKVNISGCFLKYMYNEVPALLTIQLQNRLRFHTYETKVYFFGTKGHSSFHAVEV